MNNLAAIDEFKMFAALTVLVMWIVFFIQTNSTGFN